MAHQNEQTSGNKQFRNPIDESLLVIDMGNRVCGYHDVEAHIQLKLEEVSLKKRRLLAAPACSLDRGRREVYADNLSYA